MNKICYRLQTDTSSRICFSVLQRHPRSFHRLLGVIIATEKCNCRMKSQTFFIQRGPYHYRYSIRLSGRSDIFWNNEGRTSNNIQGKPRICASTTRVGCTKFLIERTKTVPGEDILIGSDEVTMTAIVSGKRGDGIALDGADLQPNNKNNIFKFKFEAFFTGGFGVVSGSNVVMRSSGLGDRWELVD